MQNNRDLLVFDEDAWQPCDPRPQVIHDPAKYSGRVVGPRMPEPRAGTFDLETVGTGKKNRRRETHPLLKIGQTPSADDADSGTGRSR